MRRLKWGLIAAIVVSTITWMFIPVGAQVPSITLNWTAVGDDSLSNGPAQKYDLRWRDDSDPPQPYSLSNPAFVTWWNAANQVQNLPVPSAPGTAESTSVAGPFAGGKTYRFLLAVRDEVPDHWNFSNLHSRVVTILDVVRPAPIRDLR